MSNGSTWARLAFPTVVRQFISNFSIIGTTVVTTHVPVPPTWLFPKDKFPGVGGPGQDMCRILSPLGDRQIALQFIRPPAERQSPALCLGFLTWFSGYDFLFCFRPLSFLLFICLFVCHCFNLFFCWHTVDTKVTLFQVKDSTVMPQVHTLCGSARLSPHNPAKVPVTPFPVLYPSSLWLIWMWLSVLALGQTHYRSPSGFEWQKPKDIK